MKIVSTAALFLGLSATTLFAEPVEIRDCDTWEANARNLSWTLDETSPYQVYLDGELVLVDLFSEEPALGGAHLMVLNLDESSSFLECGIMTGFVSLDFAGASSEFVSGRGVVITMTVATYDGDVQEGRSLTVVYDDQTSVVSAEIE